MQKNKKTTRKNKIEIKGLLSFLIIHEINKKRLSGDELAEIIGERKDNTLTPGTIYPALKRLRRLKIIAYKRDGRKKEYYLTKDGKIELKCQYDLLRKYLKGIKNKL